MSERSGCKAFFNGWRTGFGTWKPNAGSKALQLGVGPGPPRSVMSRINAVLNLAEALVTVRPVQERIRSAIISVMDGFNQWLLKAGVFNKACLSDAASKAARRKPADIKVVMFYWLLCPQRLGRVQRSCPGRINSSLFSPSDPAVTSALAPEKNSRPAESQMSERDFCFLFRRVLIYLNRHCLPASWRSAAGPLPSRQ